MNPEVVKLTNALRGDKIVVFTSHIKRIEKHHRGGSLIHFGHLDSVRVKETISDILDELGIICVL